MAQFIAGIRMETGKFHIIVNNSTNGITVETENDPDLFQLCDIEYLKNHFLMTYTPLIKLLSYGSSFA